MAALDLRGRAIISDGASGTLNAIKGKLDAVHASGSKLAVMQNALASGSRAWGNATRAAAGAAVGAYGMTNVLRRAEEFNKAVYGVGTAAMSENVRKDEAGRVIYDIEKVRGAMQRFEGTALSLSKELGQTPTRIGNIGEVLAKAGFDDEKLRGATRAIAIVASTDMETPVQKIGEFASVLDTIYKPKDGEQWAQFFARQMDIVRIAAGETRLSVGSMMEGLRPFSALYAQMGGDEYQNAVMLMSAVRMGAESTEAGHTLKSNLARFMLMRQEAAALFSGAGFKRSDYTDASALSPTRAAGNLSKTFRAAKIDGKFRREIEMQFEKAMEDGTSSSPDFLNRMMDRVAKAAGVNMSDEVSRERFEDKFLNSVQSAGMKVNMYKLYQDMIERNVAPSMRDLWFEGRRTGTNTQLLEGMRKYRTEFEGKVGMASGAGIDATQQVYDGSSYGKLQRFNSLIEQFMIRLANSAGFETFLNGVTAIFDKLGALPQPIIDIATHAAVAAVALGPLALGIAALGVVLGPLKWIAGLAAGAGAGALGRLGVGATAGAGSAAVQAALAAGGGAAAGGLGMRMLSGTVAAGRLGLRWLPGIGLVAMGGGAAYGGYQAYQRGDSVLGGAAKGALGIFPADASSGVRSPLAGPNLGQPWNTEGGGASSVEQSTRQSIDAMRSTLAGVDLTSEGQRIGESLGNGLRSGLQSAVNAVREAGAQLRAEASAIRLNTGPNMRPAQ